jgi:nitrogen regulatory protein P-II 1
MKKIEAVIDPFKLEEVRHALTAIGIEEFSVNDIKAFGRQQGPKQTYRGTVFLADSTPEIKIELVLPDNRMEEAIGAIAKGTGTNCKISHQVFVSSIDVFMAQPSENLDPRLQNAAPFKNYA